MLSPAQERRIVELENYDPQEEGIPVGTRTGKAPTFLRGFLAALNEKYGEYAPYGAMGCDEIKGSASVFWKFVKGALAVSIDDDSEFDSNEDKWTAHVFLVGTTDDQSRTFRDDMTSLVEYVHNVLVECLIVPE